ncbi:Uncharacterised protein [Mycobacteroides abscessus]|nr:Uncharacterised protein [Mycobacteroides abscessus]
MQFTLLLKLRLVKIYHLQLKYLIKIMSLLVLLLKVAWCIYVPKKHKINCM